MPLKDKCRSHQANRIRLSIKTITPDIILIENSGCLVDNTRPRLYFLFQRKNTMSFSELAIILLSTVLVNNFVLAQFLGLCPFMGVSNKLESAIGMAGATTFVMTLASICTYLVDTWVLAPLELQYLRTIAFILVIAAVVQFVKMFMEKTSPLLYRVLGVF